MKTLRELHVEIDDWYDDGCVGYITVFRAPRSKNVDMVGETVIKLYEMDKPTQDAVRHVFDLFDGEKIEFFRDKDKNPDRIKVTRRF